jgi:phosphonate transport system permease protein
MLETFRMAVLASVIGCGVALPVAFLASRVTAPNLAAYFGDRAILSVVRAIPDFLYALIFVAAAGIGPLPGIAALVFFNIGVVAKLLSETVDGVDVGPIEASRASGAARMQTVRWAVLPQVLPNYVAYSLYTFELNIRASTVLGIVGAGGIGRLLLREYKFFNWSNVSVIIVELFVFVFVIELVSVSLRRRLV